MKDQKKIAKRRGKRISRRDFLSGAAAVAAFTIVPRHVLGGPRNTPPSEKLNIAGIGAGGQGAHDINQVSRTENIVALCDVDWRQAAETFKKFPQAKRYHDFRKMLEKEKNIEAVVVATPDHTHTVAAMMAVKMGKHVYCEKPMTHTVYEARKLTEAARETKVITQMGNQGHSGEGNRLICEWIQDGAIGPVREVYAWTDRPVWPQGIDRPKETPPIPSLLDWDLWLGPAPRRPYHPCYLPFNWRAWLDFGCGALGDMGCHIIDSPFWALKLGHPTSVEASHSYDVREMWKKVENTETYPRASIVRYTFPAREGMPPVKMTWYDGGLMPARPEELEPGRRMGDNDGGVLFVGDKGKLMCGCYGRNPRIIPETKMKAYSQPPKTMDRVPGGIEGHQHNWVTACKEGKPAVCDFDYAGPLTEVVLLGNLAIRVAKKLDWDGKNLEVTNVPEANKYVHTEYREGWTL
jgi:hypothetical protein